MKVVANVTIQGTGVTHAPGSLFEMEDGPELQRLLKLKAVEEFKSPEAEEPKTDDEFLTDEEEAAIKDDLMRVEGMTDELADKLIEAEIQSVEVLAESKKNALYKVVGKKNASMLVDAAKELVEE